VRQVEATILSGSWPNKFLQAKQFATFRSPRQMAARTPATAATRSQVGHRS